MTAFDTAWKVVKADSWATEMGVGIHNLDDVEVRPNWQRNKCVVCKDKEATTGNMERVVCEDCARPRRTGAYGRNEPAMIDCGSCNAKSKTVMDLMRCDDCGEHMCDECPGDEALCVGCHPA